MMTEAFENPEAEVKKIDHYEVRLKGSGTYTTAKTQEEAQKIAKKWEAESRAEWEKENNAEAKRTERLEELEWQMEMFHRYLKRNLWNYQHKKAELNIADFKEFVKELQDIIANKRRIAYSRSMLGCGDSYYFKDVESEQ